MNPLVCSLTFASCLLLSACADVHAQAPGGKAGADAQEAASGSVELSHVPGFYEHALSVRLTHADPEATIYYTLDGSDPDPARTEGAVYRYKNLYSYRASEPFGPFLEHRLQTHRYTGPIEVRDRSPEPDRYSRINTTLLSGLPRHHPAELPLSPFKQWLNDRIGGFNGFIARFNGWWGRRWGTSSALLPQVPLFQPPPPSHLLKGTVIRATAFKDGQTLGPTTTASYFVMPRATFKLPVVSLVAAEDRLFGYEKGILVAGEANDRFRQENPSQTRAAGNAPANWLQRGKEAEVPAHFQYFSDRLDPERASVDQGIGVRVHGGVNRAAPSKSLRLYARKEYGKANLRHAFFDEEQKYKRLLLRNSGNDFYRTMMRDAAIQQILTGLRFDVQAYQPTVVFLNGEYWGILNLREYLDKHFLSRHHGVDEDRLDIMDLDKADEGSDGHWRELMTYIDTHPLQEDRHFDHVVGQIDVDNFIDYIIANIFVVNYDWPHNNVRHWRLQVGQSGEQNPPAHDGRWRWLMFDTDAGFRDFVPDALSRLVKVDPRYNSRTAELFRSLLKNKRFEQAFVMRFSDLLNTSFKAERMVSVIGDVRSDIEAEMPRHIGRWAFPESLKVWHEGVDHLQNFARERPTVQRLQLAQFFALPGEYQVKLNVSDSLHGRIRVNSTTIDQRTPGLSGSAYPWSGTYFKQVPLEVEALPAPCHAFVRWDGAAQTEPRITLQPDADVTLTAVFRRTCAAG
jgi:hypothetical protein